MTGGYLHLYLAGHLEYFDAQQRRRQAVLLPGPVVLSALLAQLGVPVGEVSLATINGEHQSLDAWVGPGDSVELYPPMGGG